MHSRGTASLLRPFGVILLIGVLCAGLVLPVLADDPQTEQPPVTDTPSDDGSDKLWDDDPNDGSTSDGDPNEDSMTSLEELAQALADWLQKLTDVSLQ